MILIYTFVWCQVILTKRKVRLTNLLYYCKDIKLFDLQKEILIFYQRKMITKIAYISDDTSTYGNRGCANLVFLHTLY